MPIPLQIPSAASRSFNFLWGAVLLTALGSLFFLADETDLCTRVSYLGTDFRGYYALAQRAWQNGFLDAFQPQNQAAAQAVLAHTCPDGTLTPPLMTVYVPYLPVFGLLFLPLPWLPFTASYLVWSGLGMVALALYLRHFCQVLKVQLQPLLLAQWMLSLPVLANLALGQVNVFLVICLGEWFLAYQSGRYWRSGVWLAGLLIKPQTLILLLPILVISRNWSLVAGFSLGVGLVTGISLLLAGWDGVATSIRLAGGFAGPLIQTGPTMMNFRALALNFEPILPDAIAWGLAVVGMVGTAWFVFHIWRVKSNQGKHALLKLVLLTCCGTFTITWHSHFYLWMSGMPMLVILDGARRLPLGVRVWWSLGMPLTYILVYLVQPHLARNALGMAYLVFNLLLLKWAAEREVGLFLAEIPK